MRMREKQSAGNGDENRKGQPRTAGSHATCLHAPFEYRQGDDQHGEKAMQQHFRIRESCPETDGADRPSLGIASKKEKCRKAKEGKRPIARPGNSSRLRHKCEQSHRENEDARPMVVVLGPSFFGGSIRASSSLPGNVGLGGERTDFEGFFLRGISVFGKLSNRRATESWRAWRHTANDFGAGDAVVNEICGGRERRQWSGGHKDRACHVE